MTVYVRVGMSVVGLYFVALTILPLGWAFAWTRLNLFSVSDTYLIPIVL